MTLNKNNLTFYISGFVIFLIATIAMIVVSDRFSIGALRIGLVILLVPTILFLSNGFNLTQWLKSALIAILIGIIVVFARDLILLMANNVAVVPEWDFHLLWGYGRAAAEGMNPYQPGILYELIEGIGPSADLQAELFFFYPPPSLFVFAPLGWFDINFAYAVWYIIQIPFLIGMILLMWKMFWQERTVLTLLFTTALVLMFGPVKDTFMFGQTNIFMLFFILLFWHDRQHKRSGIWLTMAIFAKPIALVMLVYVVLKRRWATLGTIIATMAVLSVLTILAFGTDMFFSYFTDNSIMNDMPLNLYTEHINQSILGAILRVTNVDLTLSSPYTPLYLIIAFILTSITSVTILMLDDQRSDWILALCLTLVLLVYPKTLTVYSVILLVPIILLLGRQQEVVLKWILIPIVIVLLFALRIDPVHYLYANSIAYVVMHGLALYWLFNQRKVKGEVPATVSTT